MQEITIRGLEQEIIRALQQSAAAHGICIEEEIKRILTQVMHRKHAMDTFIHEADEFAERVGVQTIDSADLIREERDCL